MPSVMSQGQATKSGRAMTILVCPIATITAPLDTVWALLVDPATYDPWWDANTLRIEPAGTATAGQLVLASSRAFGRCWPVVTRVLSVDPEQHALDLHTTLPLGIRVRNHIVCTSADAASCRVSFG